MDYETAKKIFDYNQDTGIFRWKVARGRSKKAGEVAGCPHRTNGYIIIETGGQKYPAHRLAFLIMEGYMPEHEVDHINGKRDDNRWCNLRHVSRSCNLQNQKLYRNNRTGIPGVGWHNSKPRARVRFNKKLIDLGYHPTLLEAALARYTWEQTCSKWKCNQRSELTCAIKRMWPGFNEGIGV